MKMKIISAPEFHIEEKTAVAIGKFDGIHIGHMSLLEEILSQKKSGLKAAVFTFDLSAASFFGNDSTGEITTGEEKRQIFKRMGIDYLIEYPLNETTAHILPEDFIERILLGMLNMKYVAAGDDLSFGYRGRGNSELLKKYAADNDFEVRIIDKVKLDGNEVSSTLVRHRIKTGDMDSAGRLLGHPYGISGTVMPGYKLGRKLGFPTMNIYPDKEKILPPNGVYYSNVIYEGSSYPGLTNIGIRPTVSDEGRISVETYLYDFDRDMYGKKIMTQLLKFKRCEEKFDSKEALKATIDKDIEEGRAFFGI